MAYWLMKSEPDAYGWDDLVRDNGTEWDGVRNNAAALNLRKMAVGDRAFFYHSMTDKAAVGVMEISRTAKKTEEHTSELQSLMRISYAVFCLKKQNRSTQAE